MTYSTPPVIEQLSESCIAYVERAVGVRLDFTPETLPILDHYVTLARENIQEKPQLTPLIAQALGAYFGEMLRRYLPGFWRIPSDNVLDWQLCLSIAFLSFNPVGVAYDALFEEAEHDGPRSLLKVGTEDQEYIRRRLETLPEVPERDYFLFSTRFEVIEVIAEALHARMSEEGYEGMEFTEEDYNSGLLPLDG